MFAHDEVFSQGERQFVKFTGLIVQGDSSYGVEGAHVFIPQANRGTTSNFLGYFSMLAREGDTVHITAVGFSDYTIVVPKKGEPTYSVLIKMQTEALHLREIEIFPYATEELFKEAFLSLEIPEAKQYENMQRNLNNSVLTQMSMSLPMSASSNFRYFMDQRVTSNANRFFAPTLPLLNPFAWYQLIKSIKNGDFKKKAHQKNESEKDTYYDEDR
jgi:hypothetical protein